jgi:hypothetical protein
MDGSIVPTVILSDWSNDSGIEWTRIWNQQTQGIQGNDSDIV